MHTPPCEKCVYFIPGKYVRTDTCGRYIAYRGRGKVVYEWVDSVRFSERKCGADGKLFVSREKYMSSDRQGMLLHLMNDDE